jgi:hypothetical protein
MVGIRKSCCCEKVLWWVLKEWEGRKMGNEWMKKRIINGWRGKGNCVYWSEFIGQHGTNRLSLFVL